MAFADDVAWGLLTHIQMQQELEALFQRPVDLISRRSVLDIARAAHLIRSFIAGMPKDDFLIDQKTQSTMLHQLSIVSEAVKRLSRAFRNQHPILPWALMSGMRDHSDPRV